MARQETILLFWDCPECGHEHIPGPSHRCPNCFWWRDRTVEFYEAPDSRVLSPEEVAQYQGPDWICKVCGAANPERGEPVEHLVCGNCGQWQTNSLDLGDTAPQALPTGQAVAQVEGEWHEGFRLSSVEASPRQTQARSKTSKTGARRHYRWIILTGVAIATACGVLLGLWRAVTPRTIVADVVARTWTVGVEVQELRPVAEGGWNLPAGAYNVSTSQRQRGTRQVQIGTETEQVQVSYQEQVGTREECTTVSLGDGTGSRSCTDVPVYETRYRTETREVPVYRTEPVYDLWYDYMIDTWQPLETVEVWGADDEPRQPPLVSLRQQPYPQQALAPVETCRIQAQYERRQELETATWILPCDQYDQLTTGQTATFQRSFGRTTLKGAP